MGERSGKQADIFKQRQLEEKVMSARGNSRETMPIELWEQRQHYSSPYGYFVKSCNEQQSKGHFHSARLFSTNSPTAPPAERLARITSSTSKAWALSTLSSRKASG